MIPISAVQLDPAVERQVVEVLRSGVIAQGPKVAELERRFAELTEVEHAVAVNSGSTALLATLQVLGIGPGDEVVTSPFTFVATLNAILHAGATARLADIDADDFALEPQAAANAITGGTAALLPVHLYGQTADMGQLTPLAAMHGLALVEDAAQAHGARFAGRPAGSFGVGCFSFYATKNVTTGEGGMITTDDARLADQLRLLRNQGMRERYSYELPGHNWRMTDIAAAMALPQLDRYGDQVQRRRTNAARLSNRLKEAPDVLLPRQLPGREHVWHQFTIQLVGPVDRDELAARLADRGIGSGIYYPRLVHDYPCYREHPRVIAGDLAVASAVAARCLSLPVHAGLSDADVDQVADAVLAALS